MLVVPFWTLSNLPCCRPLLAVATTICWLIGGKDKCPGMELHDNVTMACGEHHQWSTVWWLAWSGTACRQRSGPRQREVKVWRWCTTQSNSHSWVFMSSGLLGLIGGIQSAAGACCWRNALEVVFSLVLAECPATMLMCSSCQGALQCKCPAMEKIRLDHSCHLFMGQCPKSMCFRTFLLFLLHTHWCLKKEKQFWTCAVHLEQNDPFGQSGSKQHNDCHMQQEPEKDDWGTGVVPKNGGCVCHTAATGLHILRDLGQ